MMKLFSFGGGVQSTAALVLAAQGLLEVDAFLFANVGEDSESPDTLRYVREVSMPYAARHNITLLELRKVLRSGNVETLYGRLTKPGGKSTGIPVRLAGSGAPANRSCTQDFKIRVLQKYAREHGATAKNPALQLLGISRDEALRARIDSGVPYTRLGYPFLNRLGAKEYPFLPQTMSRMDCMNVITHAGLPIPPKSSCWFCPYHTLKTWRDLRDHNPELFQKACDLEAHLTAKVKTYNRHSPKALPAHLDAVYMTDKLIPLARAVGDGVQPSLFEDEICDSGYCFV